MAMEMAEQVRRLVCHTRVYTQITTYILESILGIGERLALGTPCQVALSHL